MKERRALYVFYKSHKNLRNLSRFGEVIFTSQKYNYSCLYVDQLDLNAIVLKLKEQNYVCEVRIGVLQELSSNFALAFIKTNEELKKTVDYN